MDPELADVGHHTGAETAELGHLREPGAGLVQHAVHSRRTVAVGRDLRDEEQLGVGHAGHGTEGR